jgi:hypothetical protein
MKGVTLHMSRQGAIIGAYIALSAATGAVQAFLRMHAIDLRIAAVVSLLPFAILLFVWCNSDCARRGISPPAGAALLVAGIAIIGIPYYYFRILAPLEALGYVLCAYLILGVGVGTTVLVDQTVSQLLAV